MVYLTIELVTEGLPLNFEVGEFATRVDALRVAAMIEREANAADEDVTYCGCRIEDIGASA
jgi:hypothetical protein